MQTLDIECPSCGDQLELDAGFAGGVCRCSSCGTLMTVPSDAGKAESLSRPTSSASIGTGGLSSMGVPDPGPRRTSDRRSTNRRGKGKKGKAAKGKQISTTVEPGEYRTASGKVIRVDENTRVPMAAGKRKQIRVATTMVFFGIVAAVVAIAVVAIVMMMNGPGGPGGRSGAVAYDPAANPYTLTFGNVMGLPVTDRTVVVIEASEFSGAWMPQAGDMLAAGLSQKASGGEVSLIGAGAKPANFAGGAPRKLPIDASETSGWFTKLPATGEADYVAAIKAALALKPDTLILAVGYAESSDIEAWEKLISAQKDLAVHVVLIGDSSTELQGWMNSRDGEIVILSASDIETLKGMAGQKAISDESSDE